MDWQADGATRTSGKIDIETGVGCSGCLVKNLLTAMRKRDVGHSSPGEGEAWGFGRWVGIMRTHWGDPDFGVGHIYPWVIDAHQLMLDGNTLGLERLFMRNAWEHLGRAGAGHYFDFEAVAVYVLRWDLIDRWTRYDAETATERITGLAEDGLGDYRTMYH